MIPRSDLTHRSMKMGQREPPERFMRGLTERVGLSPEAVFESEVSCAHMHRRTSTQDEKVLVFVCHMEVAGSHKTG